jgi:RNA polymerase sigma-70 factor (ECF subfamily)
MSEIDDAPTTAAELLWRQHADELLRFATVLVGPTDANDIVVEAFLRCVPSLATPGIDNQRAYLFRAVNNRALDLRRSRHRRWARDIAAILPTAHTTPDPLVDVRRAVATLSVAQRAVVYLVYWEDLTERSAAETLQVSPGTVRRHLTRARTHLRKELR